MMLGNPLRTADLRDTWRQALLATVIAML